MCFFSELWFEVGRVTLGNGDVLYFHTSISLGVIWSMTVKSAQTLPNFCCCSCNHRYLMFRSVIKKIWSHVSRAQGLRLYHRISAVTRCVNKIYFANYLQDRSVHKLLGKRSIYWRNNFPPNNDSHNLPSILLLQDISFMQYTLMFPQHFVITWKACLGT